MVLDKRNAFTVQIIAIFTVFISIRKFIFHSLKGKQTKFLIYKHFFVSMLNKQNYKYFLYIT